MRSGWAVTTDQFFPDATQHEYCEAGPFYFAWGCFRDFMSGPAVYRRRGAASGREIVGASRSRRIDSTATHHALAWRGYLATRVTGLADRPSLLLRVRVTTADRCRSAAAPFRSHLEA
jgi:hypothetical protein